MQASPVPAPTGERDQYVDFLRALAVLLIVIGHWFTASVWWSHTRVGVRSVLADLPWLIPASWLFVALPLLFFVGGFVHARMLPPTRGPIGRFLAARATRLLIPAGAFALAWFVIQAGLHAAGLGGGHLIRGVSRFGVMPFGVLWFLPVYLMVAALAPLTLALHGRFGAWVPAGLTVAVAAVDTLRFNLHVPAVGWLNLLLVWLLPHQLGYALADGRFSSSAGRRAAAALAAGGALALVLLVLTARYPGSIGGVPHDRISNLKPPTLPVVGLAALQCGLAVLAEPRARELLTRPAVRYVFTRVRGVTLTIYLWHMTALLAVLVMGHPLGLTRTAPNLRVWWLQRPLWLLGAAAVLALLVRLLGPLEQVRVLGRRRSRASADRGGSGPGRR